MATGVVSYSSDLKRKRWMRMGLIQAASKSFWAPYTGMTKDNVIFQTNNKNADEGHTVVFDFDGNLSGRAYKNKETAYGKGEQKKKFSDKITVDRYRIPVDNGDAFDGVDVGDLSITQHTDSRSKLADLFVRWKDQMIFDALQGFKDGDTPSHTIQINASATNLSYADLDNIVKIIKTGTGYKTGTFGSGTAASSRAPLVPFRTADGKPVWLMIVDNYVASNLRQNSTVNSGVMALAQHADMRGNNNRVFTGVIGKIGQLVIIEADTFFGHSAGNGLDQTEVEIAGMRQYDSNNTAWSGESSFVSAVYSRCLVLGASACQVAFGKEPDYKWQPSQDFAIKSESVVEFWTNAKKTNLTVETGADYKKAKRASLDHGVIAVDIKIA